MARGLSRHETQLFERLDWLHTQVHGVPGLNLPCPFHFLFFIPLSCCRCFHSPGRRVGQLSLAFCPPSQALAESAQTAVLRKECADAFAVFDS